MSDLSQEGILLRSHPYSETSRILRFLTPDHGLLSVMARGQRRNLSKGQGGVESFDQVALTISYRERRDLQTLKELKVTRSRHRLGRELLRFSGATLLAEFLLGHALEEESHRLFQVVTDSLDALEKCPGELTPAILLSGGWQILGVTGFTPSLNACAHCGGSLPSQGMLRFSAQHGGLLCAACGEDRRGARLGPGARADLAGLVAGTPSPDLRGARAHLGILEAFALHHLAPSRPFASVALIRNSLHAASVQDEPA